MTSRHPSGRPGLLAITMALVALTGLSGPRAARGEGVVPLPRLPLDSESAWRQRFFEARMTGAPLQGAYDPTQLFDPASEGLFPAQGAATGADGQWSEIPPPALWLHTSIYDPIRDRIVVFGGVGYRGASGDVWALNLTGSPHWSLLVSGGAGPSARSRHSAIYDPVRERMLIFGGLDNAYRDDVWALSLAGDPAWTHLDVAAGPPARGWQSAIYDPVRDRMVIFGGTNGAQPLGDVWALSLSGTPQWSALSPAGTGPGPRSHQAAVYDAPRDRIVFQGGIDGSGVTHNDVWALSLSGTPAWSQLLPAGTPPSARFGAGALYDPVRQRLVLFAGGTGVPNQNDTWALSLSGSPAWTQLSPVNPPSGRQFHAVIYDPIGDRMVVHGGSNGPILSGTWALSLSASQTWIPLSGTRRRGHVSAYDAARGRMVVFGGEDVGPMNDVWEMGLTGADIWLKLTPEGTPPQPRVFHAGVYDPQRDRMLVFGGRDSAPLGDTWELSFSGSLAWRQIFASGTPPSARLDHAAVYDPARHRMLVLGGATGVGAVLDDVWALSLSGSPSWTRLYPGGSAPEARGGAVAVFDPIGDRVLLFGGYDKNLNCLGDLWQLSLGGTPAWSQLSSAGSPPAARMAGAAAYDAQGQRMVLFGGTDLIEYFSDTWELALAGAPAWRLMAPGGMPPLARSDHRVIYDPQAGGLVVYGGSGLGGGLLNDTWGLALAGVISVAGPPPAVHLSPAYPNPTRGATRFELSAPAPGELTVSIYAVNGRLVRRLASEVREAGRHAATWDGLDSEGRRTPAGVYFYQARFGGERQDGKVVVVN